MTNPTVAIGEIPQEFWDSLAGLDEATTKKLTDLYLAALKGDAHVGTHSGTREGLEVEREALEVKIAKLRAHLAAALIERDAAAERLDEIED